MEREQLTEPVDVFALQRYAFLPNLLEPPTLSRIYAYACKIGKSLSGIAGDDQVPGTPSAYGDFQMEGLLIDLHPEIERLSGLSLYPTYSYFRVYKHGDILRRHTDRSSCEISLSLCLGFEDGWDWPLSIEGPQGFSSIKLSAGDGLLYRGIECPHWRDAYQGHRLAQVFLHYVDRNGPHAEWKYDRRESPTRGPKA